MKSPSLKCWSTILAISTLTSFVARSDGLRILGIFPQNLKSHFVMNEQLARGLAAKGHRVDVYGHFPLKESIPNYEDFNIQNAEVRGYVNNMSYEFVQEFRNTISVSQLVNQFGAELCKQLGNPVFNKLINDPPNDPPYDVVIVQPFTSNCFYAFGHHLNIPLVGIETTTLTDWAHHYTGTPQEIATTPSLYSKYAAPMSFYERLLNFCMTMHVKYTFLLQVGNQDAYVEKYFGKDFPSTNELSKDVDLLLVNYNQKLQGIKTFAPSVVPVGGLHIAKNDVPLSKDVEKFLNESAADGFIYFSFGSMVRIETFSKSMLDAFYSTFEEIKPVRVLWKIAKPEMLPAGLPENVLTSSWLPQTRVLRHKNIKAFVTHGGLMGTVEALHCGVPLIGVPLFADQLANMDLYVKKKIAVKLNLDELTKETFLDAVVQVLDNPSYKKEAEALSRQLEDSPMSPVDTAVFWIEYVARHGKKCLRSPLVDMPWWQSNLLDVYAFIGLILVLILLGIRIIIKTLWRAIFHIGSRSKSKQS